MTAETSQQGVKPGRAMSDTQVRLEWTVVQHTWEQVVFSSSHAFYKPQLVIALEFSPETTRRLTGQRTIPCR